MYSSIIITLVFATCSAIAQQATVVCIPGQCLEGYSNVTIGAVVSSPSAPANLHLLPGQYTSTSSPQILHDVLTASSSSLSPSAGFNVSSSVTLPLNLQLQPGLATFTETLYSGRTAFAGLPSSPVGNTSTLLNAGSITLSPGVWAALKAGTNRIVLWDSIPDLSQLAISTTTALSLSDLESSACSPPCSGSGVCTTAGTCQCPQGFTGSSCESCATGFFGPHCQSCPSNCTSCNDGINGSGLCLQPIAKNAPSSCNCLNGLCGSDGQCACNPGFTKADNGTACAKCLPGFFLSSNGNCQVCQLGCVSCADGSGQCTQCQSGFSLDNGDHTKCLPPQQVTGSGTVCPERSFSNGNSCQLCDSTCQTCKGSTSNDCTLCATNLFSVNGTCVTTNTDGVCTGTNLIADNNKRECDSCPAKCTSCKIPNFNIASTVDQLQCTGCLPGFFLSKGQCVSKCPDGTFVNPEDNLTCTACDSSCGTCVGSSTFCLSCSGGQLASGGKCVQSCPENTFQSSGSCLPCHPDCATCSGGNFNQCSSCSSDRPVPVNGRCLPTCAKSQFFDTTTSSCQSCDSSCSSCSGAGPSNCLACSGANSVLRSGSCTNANCASNSTVVPGLGVCLSDLVFVPQGSQTSNLPPLPTITGLNNPTNVTVVRQPLTWWEILLMVLGCLFIFVAILWLCRRRAKKRREKETAKFGAKKRLEQPKKTWKQRLARLGEWIFRHHKTQTKMTYAEYEAERVQITKIIAAEEARKPSKGSKPALSGDAVERVNIAEIIAAVEGKPSKDSKPALGDDEAERVKFAKILAAWEARKPSDVGKSLGDDEALRVKIAKILAVVEARKPPDVYRPALGDDETESMKIAKIIAALEARKPSNVYKPALGDNEADMMELVTYQDPRRSGKRHGVILPLHGPDP